MSHNNSYGNFAGIKLKECLPNITGQYQTSTWHQIYDGPNAGYYNSNSALYTNHYAGYRPVHSEPDYGGGISFDANRSNGTYRNNCKHVRPYSYAVYIWVRNS